LNKKNNAGGITLSGIKNTTRLCNKQAVTEKTKTDIQTNTEQSSLEINPNFYGQLILNNSTKTNYHKKGLIEGLKLESAWQA
jgi:hypothetical protein